MQLTANYIYTPQGFVQNHLIEVDEAGVVQAFRPIQSQDQPKRYEGLLVPGFVNVHCHLELSGMKGMIPRATGMVDFAKSVVQKRGEVSDEAAEKALEAALQEMWQTGTAAVGDICNTPDTIQLKQQYHQLFFHNFIELLGRIGSKASAILEKGKQLQASFASMASTLTLHAPYSVSVELRDVVYQQAAQKGDLLSIHLLESLQERELFEQQSGEFIDFFQMLGIPTDVAVADSLAYITESLPPKQPTIFIHNTEMTQTELATVASRFPQAFFGLCPRSNLYIHDRLPNFADFLPYRDRVCLGTDSLASNDSLDMLAEMRCIQSHQKEVDLHTLILWASTTGAKALQQSHKFGTFAVGSQPRVLLLPQINPHRLEKNCQIELIA